MQIWLHSRLGRFRWVLDSTWFQIENRNLGSALLKNRVPASVGSGADSFKYPIPRAAAPVKYPIPRAKALVKYRFWDPTPGFSQNTQFSLMSHRQNVTLDCSELTKVPHTTDANRNVCAILCISSMHCVSLSCLQINWPHNKDMLLKTWQHVSWEVEWSRWPRNMDKLVMKFVMLLVFLNVLWIWHGRYTYPCV